MNFIDFKKYKRFFTFGCSFTNHFYPTWANVVASEMPDAKFYNFGLTGSGNQLINIRLSEADVRFKFCETDLIMTMYSTFYREDRWVRGRWLTGGNVYNNDIYDKNFLEKYADTTGYIIRDLALINSTYHYIKSLSCDSFFMMSSDWKNEISISTLADELNYPKIKDVLEIYNSMLEKNFPPPMFSEVSKYFMKNNVEFINLNGNKQNDPHPTPNKYREYLKEIGVPLTEASERYVSRCMDMLSKVKHQRDFEILFPEVSKQNDIGATGNILF